MKHRYTLPALLVSFIFLGNCASEAKRALIQPAIAPQKQSKAWLPAWQSVGQIIESENGPGDASIPEWLSRYLSGGEREVESMGKYFDRYVFIGKMDGNNFSALSKWSEAFSAERELPRMVTMRIEERLVSAASLYPGDEYGDFFELLITPFS